MRRRQDLFMDHHASEASLFGLSDIQDPGVTCYLRLRTMALTNLVGDYAAGWQRRQRRTQPAFVSAIHHIVVLTKVMPRWSDCLRGRSCKNPRTVSPRRKEQAVHPPTEQSAGRAWPPGFSGPSAEEWHHCVSLELQGWRLRFRYKLKCLHDDWAGNFTFCASPALAAFPFFSRTREQHRGWTNSLRRGSE